MEDLINQFQKIINDLEAEKEKYIKEEDQYSFWVVDDEQEIWKKAKKLAVDHSLKKQTGTPAPEQ